MATSQYKDSSPAQDKQADSTETTDTLDTTSSAQQTNSSVTTTGSTAAPDTRQPDDMNEQRLIELEEERKLKARNPTIQRPGSEFLQKRLQRGLKYFDSGDYNMAKASTNPNVKLPDVAAPMPAIDSKILSKRH